MANIVEIDWKTEGDGKAFLDQSKGTEWIQLSETRGMSAQSVIDATHKGGEFEGFRIANSSEVDVLVDSLKSYMLSGNNRYVDTGFYTKRYSDRSEYRLGCQYSIKRPVQCSGFIDKVLGVKSAIYSTNAREKFDSYGLFARGDGYSQMEISFDHTWGGRIFLENRKTTVSYLGPNQRVGYFLISDGGNTLSSQLDPSIMANNPESPVNVSNPAIGIFAGLGLLSFAFRGNRNANQRHALNINV